ncbi:MAG TPA: CheR family methyltransferase [Ktedonobacteraceae bacterium]|nr:CheR family methyltransferase [Ktedonobacteraceae bacterium]
MLFNNEQLDNRIVSLTLQEQAKEEQIFSYLYHHLLPSLLLRGREQGCSLRCWVIGHDMGRQAFWLAMQLTDLLGDELPKWTIRIFVSEVDHYTLTLARRGLYTADELLAFPVAYQERFFRKLEGRYQVALSIRSLLLFALHDPSQNAPFPRIDLALAPEFLTYSPDQQQRILTRLTSSLYPEGLLIIDEQAMSVLSSPYYEIDDPGQQVYRCLTTPLLLKQFRRLQQNRQRLVDSSPAFPYQNPSGNLAEDDSKEKLLALTAHEMLSSQETHVLHYLEMGLSNKEIAQKMVITVGTVKRHTGNIYTKLEVHSRTAAVARARSLKLLE